MGHPERCDWGGCSRSVVTTFGEKALCLDHFCNRCYEILDAMEAGKRLNPAGSASPLLTKRQVQVADECARKTLDVCMSKINLNNLERARLLDILLWCGDVVNALARRNGQPENERDEKRKSTDQRVQQRS